MHDQEDKSCINEYDFLIVENDPAVIEFYDDFKQRYEQVGGVDFAEDYGVAINALCENDYDVVITARTQSSSNIEDGLEFLDLVRNNFDSDIITGVTSGYPSDMDRGTDIPNQEGVYDFYISGKGWNEVLEEL